MTVGMNYPVPAEPARLAYATLQGALIRPYVLPVVPGFCGGLVLGDGPVEQRLRQRRHYRPVDRFVDNEFPLRSLSGEFVYGGPCYGHFGHVMAEMIHRVLPSRARFACRRLLFVDGCFQPAPPGGWHDLAPAMQAALTFLEVRPDEVIVIRDNRVVETLHVAQQGSEAPVGAWPEYLQMLKAFTAARLATLPDRGPAGTRVYVSRSALREGGLILGESYIEAALAAEGWTIFHPEDWPLVDQMQVYRRAEILLFPAGSAVHGAELFGPGDLGHCVLLPRGHAPDIYFEAVLRPRARRYDVLTGAAQIGTAAADGQGHPIPELGVSVLDLPGFIGDLRRLELAELSGFSPTLWRDRAWADLEHYIALHVARSAGAAVPTVSADALAQLRSRVRDRLSPPPTGAGPP